MELRIRHEDNGTAVIAVHSESLDAGNVERFRDQVLPVLAAADGVVIDMGELGFVDSSGLGALIACLRNVRGRGGELSLVRLRKPVRALFELMRMDQVFTLHDSVEAALGARA